MSITGGNSLKITSSYNTLFCIMFLYLGIYPLFSRLFGSWDTSLSLNVHIALSLILKPLNNYDMAPTLCLINLSVIVLCILARVELMFKIWNNFMRHPHFKNNVLQFFWFIPMLTPLTYHKNTQNEIINAYYVPSASD